MSARVGPSVEGAPPPLCRLRKSSWTMPCRTEIASFSWPSGIRGSSCSKRSSRSCSLREYGLPSIVMTSHSGSDVFCHAQSGMSRIRACVQASDLSVGLHSLHRPSVHLLGCPSAVASRGTCAVDPVTFRKNGILAVSRCQDQDIVSLSHYPSKQSVEMHLVLP